MPLADDLLGPAVAAELHERCVAADPNLDWSPLREATTDLDGRALRERSDLLRDALLACVPGDSFRLNKTVRLAAADPGLTGWMVWPVTTAVAERAVATGGDAAFDDAMRLLAELTGRHTSEFAIRSLLRADITRGLTTVIDWATRVPELTARPEVTLPILTALFRDPSPYVRRSVSNHLNDLSRHAPGLVVATASDWLRDTEAGDADQAQVTQTTKHGLRTLIKQGHPGALALLGFAPAELAISGPLIDNPSMIAGGTVHFTGTIANIGSTPARLAIDYVVHHARARGRQTEKVFKLSTVTLSPGEQITIDRSHSFRPITTRRYYPGLHAIELQVNGVRHGRAEFTIEAAA